MSRDIDGELILVPLASGIGDADDELYALSSTGRSVWHLLDGERTLADVVAALEEQYEASRGEIERDVLGFATEMLRRGMMVEIPPETVQ